MTSYCTVLWVQAFEVTLQTPGSTFWGLCFSAICANGTVTFWGNALCGVCGGSPNFPRRTEYRGMLLGAPFSGWSISQENILPCFQAVPFIWGVHMFNNLGSLATPLFHIISNHRCEFVYWPCGYSGFFTPRRLLPRTPHLLQCGKMAA